MNPLTETEKRELTKLIAAGEPLPDVWQRRLFPNSRRTLETGKEYRPVYDGKLKREEVLAQTPADQQGPDRFGTRGKIKFIYKVLP